MCGPVLGVLASFGYIMFMSVCTRAIVWFGLVSIELILLTFSFACFCKAGVVDVAGFVRKACPCPPPTSLALLDFGVRVLEVACSVTGLTTTAACDTGRWAT